MTSVSILIPTLSGRERYLDQTVSGYVRNTPSDVDLELVILRDRPTCGIGWQEAADRTRGDYLHFSNDDIYPWPGWLPPLLDLANEECVVGPWINHGPWGQFYAAPEGQVLCDRPTDIDHSAMPFMRRDLFRERIAPIVPIHFGVDNWIAHRARAANRRVVGCPTSVICHFAAQAGRAQGDWTEQDLLDFDAGLTLPKYVSGELSPWIYPPDRLTPKGLERARTWRAENVR